MVCWLMSRTNRKLVGNLRVVVVRRWGIPCSDEWIESILYTSLNTLYISVPSCSKNEVLTWLRLLSLCTTFWIGYLLYITSRHGRQMWL